MSCLVVIPARFASSRFPGKPLVELSGSSGIKKSLIRRTWDAAGMVKGVDQVVIATDDNRIAQASAEFGARVVMTSSTCRNGTERCAEVLERVDEDFDLVVNLQGDAPLTPPWFVEDLLARFEDNRETQMATPILRCTPEMVQALREDRRNGRVGATTAIPNAQGQAIYFSKEVLPFGADGQAIPAFHHVGVYAYTPAALRRYASIGETVLERAEGLEQLRFLVGGVPVDCVEVDARGRSFWELNNPEDVSKIETMMKEMGLE